MQPDIYVFLGHVAQKINGGGVFFEGNLVLNRNQKKKHHFVGEGAKKSHTPRYLSGGGRAGGSNCFCPAPLRIDCRVRWNSASAERRTQLDQSGTKTILNQGQPQWSNADPVTVT